MNDINLAVEPVPGKAARHAPCQNGRISMTQVIENIGAGEGNRTLVISLEGRGERL